MNYLSGHPGWSYKIKRSYDGCCLLLDIYFKGLLAGTAKLVVFNTMFSEDVLEALHLHGDILCVEAELEQFLTMNPGRYIWLDAFERKSDSADVKGTLTTVLGCCLNSKALGLSEAHEVLAFPCPYGTGDLEDSEERESLTKWYVSKLGATRIEYTPFIRIPYS